MDPQGNERFGYLDWLGLKAEEIQLALRLGPREFLDMQWQIAALMTISAYLGLNKH